MKEIPLPSGRVAHMRPMTWWDWVATGTAPCFDMRVLLVAARCTHIDGKPLTVEEASAMPLVEAGPLVMAVSAQLSEALMTKALEAAQPAPTLQ